MKPVLTEKQKRFIDYYVETGNATEAAKKAGYSEKTAAVTGHDNLRKPNIKSAIDARLKELEEKRVADAREVLIVLTAILRGESEGEELVCVGTGNGLSKPVKVIKHPSIRDKLEAAKCLMKRYGLDMSDVERDEKKARTEALRKETEAQDTAQEQVIIAGEGEILE